MYHRKVKCHLAISKAWTLRNLKSHKANHAIPNFGFSTIHMTNVYLQGCTIMYDIHMCVNHKSLTCPKLDNMTSYAKTKLPIMTNYNTQIVAN